MAAADEDVEAAARVLGRPVSFIGRLTGGQHAVTTMVSDGHDDYVVRRFPPGDLAVARELVVLPRIAALGATVPRLIGSEDTASGPVIVTSRVSGAAPGPFLAPTTIASEMARALAGIHALDGTGLASKPVDPPAGDSRLAARAWLDWPEIEPLPRVLGHSDFWCGNALWHGGVLTGVVDWSSAANAPRGLDVAWCRQDLMLLGSQSAADQFLSEYENRAGESVGNVAAWDRYAAAHADPIVDTWAPNYAGIGRPHLTAEVLRRRFDRWVLNLLEAG